MSIRRGALLAACVALICSVLAVYSAIAVMNSPGPSPGAVVVVERGTSTRTIVRRLIDSGAIDVPDWLVMVWLRLGVDRGPLQAGEYSIRSGSSAVEVLDLIRSGTVVQHRITLAEGLTARQWLERLADDRLSQQRGDREVVTLLETDDPIEGWLFPDTYQFTSGTSDIDILRRAYRRAREVLRSEWEDRDPGLPLDNPYEALVLASVVEKETGLASDRRRVAQVFVNRLKLGMRLQSDPTVIYGIADFDGDLRRSDLRRDGPYNTYMRHGLPPTPICNPGLAAIRAVLHPEPGDFLYFVARGDGSSQFSRTLEEHNRAVRKYQLGGGG